jgi:hypothetical protein
MSAGVAFFRVGPRAGSAILPRDTPLTLSRNIRLPHKMDSPKEVPYLSDELWVMIIDQLDSEDALAKLARCSKRLYGPSVSRLYEDVRLDYGTVLGQGRCYRFAMTIFQHQQLRPLVNSFGFQDLLADPAENGMPEEWISVFQKANLTGLMQDVLDSLPNETRFDPRFDRSYWSLSSIWAIANATFLSLRTLKSLSIENCTARGGGQWELLPMQLHPVLPELRHVTIRHPDRSCWVNGLDPPVLLDSFMGDALRNYKGLLTRLKHLRSLAIRTNLFYPNFPLANLLNPLETVLSPHLVQLWLDDAPVNIEPPGHSSRLIEIPSAFSSLRHLRIPLRLLEDTYEHILVSISPLHTSLPPQLETLRLTACTQASWRSLLEDSLIPFLTGDTSALRARLRVITLESTLDGASVLEFTEPREDKSEVSEDRELELLEELMRAATSLSLEPRVRVDVLDGLDLLEMAPSQGPLLRNDEIVTECRPTYRKIRSTEDCVADSAG